MIAVALIAGLAAAGCGPSDRERTDVAVAWDVFPEPVRVGETTVTVHITDDEGSPIRNADVVLEGTMSHPGMRPVRVVGRETRPGRYAGMLRLTMAGDWVFILEATLADGSSVRREHEVPDVRLE
jgi:hypothetical protein